MTTYGLTAAGYTAPRQADYLAIIRGRFDAALADLGYTETPDYERDTFEGQITEIMAYLLGELASGNQAVYDARSPANATGLQLDNLALIVGVPRNEATYGTVELTLTGTTGTIITAGKVVEGGGSDGKARWVLTEDVTLVAGTGTGTARAEFKGQVIATAGQVDAIVTPVSGWTAVTNAAAADPGQERETDAELRVRRQQSLSAAGAGSTAAILAALLDLDFVSGAVVRDNKTSASVTTDGITIAAFGVACVVAPNTLTTAQKTSVVEAIYEHLGAGTPTSGTTSSTVTKRDARTESINFYLAADSNVTVAFTLLMESGYVAADVEEDLEELVTDYFLTLGVGASVYPSPIIALAMAIDGIANVTTLLLNGGAGAVTHTALQQPVLSTFSVA